MNSAAPSPAPSATYAAFAPTRPAVVTQPVRRRLPWAKLAAGAAGVLVLAAAMGGLLYHAAGSESTDDAYLEGDVHPVSARISGTVSRVLVDDNAHVQAGQPLVEIDPADLNLAVAAASADLVQARANADQVRAQTARARAELAAATARVAENAAGLTRTELDFHRAAALAGDPVRAISTQELDAARAAFDAASAARQSLLAERAAAEAALAAAQAQGAVAGAQIQKAEATLQTAQLQVAYTVVPAPVAGRVAKKSVEAGQRLQPGQPVMAIVEDGVWVVANFKEGQLAHLQAGQPVRVTVDAVSGQSFTGTVDSFSPGTGAQFSLLPPDNATGNFTKVVQRLPVKIRFSPATLGAAAGRLAPGLSAVVTVATRS